MSASLEIQKLRLSLRQNGDMDFSTIDSICDEATEAINNTVVSIVSEAVSEAIDYALSIGAKEFIDDIQVLPNSSGIYQISTHSGILDYSKDSVQNLPNLLQNAKVSESGHRYKVIPIQQKDSKVERSMFSMLQAQQDNIDEARNAIRKQAGHRKANLTEQLNDSLSRQITGAKATANIPTTRSGPIEFRTATDRQDSSSAWVIPRKEMNMEMYIQDLNRKLLTHTEHVIIRITDEYSSMYGGGY